MEKHPSPIPAIIARPRWCKLVDPAAGGPLKLCLGLSDCGRCAFAQWLDLMEADRPSPRVAGDIGVAPRHVAAA